MREKPGYEALFNHPSLAERKTGSLGTKLNIHPASIIRGYLETSYELVPFSKSVMSLVTSSNGVSPSLLRQLTSI